ncbi:MAG TPA: TfoX/Sxy family protein [Microvirga sp.]|jgi:DNA transformation protein|nr:TfoX/Sxy family protein [Microvirga sp.]
MDPQSIQDLFQGLGPVRTRRMFGGQGIYRHERIFALEVGGEIYLKADAETIARFEAAGSRAFSYRDRNGRVTTMSYWLMPSEAADDPAEAARWGRLALEAAERAERAKTAKAGRRRSA